MALADRIRESARQREEERERMEQQAKRARWDWIKEQLMFIGAALIGIVVFYIVYMVLWFFQPL